VREVICIADDNIIADVAANNGGVVQSNRHAQIVKLQVIGFQFANPDQAEEFTIPHQIRIEGIRHEQVIPIVGSIDVSDEDFDPAHSGGDILFRSCFGHSEMVFIFPLGKPLF
jgi:hypothetical protein